jgi:hypothetical protein
MQTAVNKRFIGITNSLNFQSGSPAISPGSKLSLPHPPRAHIRRCINLSRVWMAREENSTDRGLLGNCGNYRCAPEQRQRRRGSSAVAQADVQPAYFCPQGALPTGP